MARPFVLGTALLGLGIVAAQPARAAVITGIADDFTIDWFLGAGQPDNDGGATSTIDLSATATFDVTAFGATSVTLHVTFSNTTVLSGGITEAGVTTFGIGVTPNATAVTFSDAPDGAFVDAALKTGQQNFPGGFKDIDVCVFTQGCSGGAQGTALAAGATDSFMLTIFGNFSGGSVTLAPFPVKFQTTKGSYAFAGNEHKVPEPSALLLFGVGLVGLGVLVKRQRRGGGRPASRRG